MWEEFKAFILESYMICLPIVLGYIIWLLKRNKEREDTDRRKSIEEAERQEKMQHNSIKGTTMVLRYIMKQYHTDYMIQGFVTSEQLKDYNEVFEVYVSLGGNSVAVRWHEEINDLPVREKK